MSDGYWRRVHLRAIADAGKELHIESRGRLVIALLGAAAAIVALAFLGSSDASRDEMIARAAIGGIVILLFPFVYLWKFLGTPARLEQELETRLSARIDEQAAQIADLREQIKPRLALGRIKGQLAYDSTAEVTAERKLIEIVNAGNEMLRECIAVVERVLFDDDAVVEPRAAIKTTARDADGVSGRFKLSPGIPKELVLTSRETGNARMPGIHRLCLEACELHLNRGKSGLIEIAVGCEVGKPTRMALRFSVDEKYLLTLEPAEVS